MVDRLRNTHFEIQARELIGSATERFYSALFSAVDLAREGEIDYPEQALREGVAIYLEARQTGKIKRRVSWAVAKDIIAESVEPDKKGDFWDTVYLLAEEVKDKVPTSYLKTRAPLIVKGDPNMDPKTSLGRIGGADPLSFEMGLDDLGPDEWMGPMSDRLRRKDE